MICLQDKNVPQSSHKLIEFKNVIQLYLYCYENGDIWREIA